MWFCFQDCAGVILCAAERATQVALQVKFVFSKTFSFSPIETYSFYHSMFHAVAEPCEKESSKLQFDREIFMKLFCEKQIDVIYAFCYITLYTCGNHSFSFHIQSCRPYNV